MEETTVWAQEETEGNDRPDTPSSVSFFSREKEKKKLRRKVCPTVVSCLPSVVNLLCSTLRPSRARDERSEEERKDETGGTTAGPTNYFLSLLQSVGPGGVFPSPVSFPFFLHLH